MAESNSSLLVARERDFSDLPLSLAIHPNKKDIGSLKDISAIKQSVKNLVLTNFGERPFNRNLGGNITALLFENADIYTAIMLENTIRDLLQEYEPRVKLIEVSVDLDADANTLVINIEFLIIGLQEVQTISLFLNRIR